MAAEFKFIVDRAIQKYQRQIECLQIKQQKCQAQVEDLYKNDEKIKNALLIECNKDINNFNNYLQQYRQQQINSMTEICYQELQLFNDINSLEYKTAKRNCIRNQLLNNVVFEQNIQLKLNGMQV
ncbi:unnamed protein product [Paramecium primaurelia]|uniref:Uncharacterized protein n=1 Tax=Paramecium primaurelia TaxID=5886 RepID=A0A8S1JQG9_PARPR|nr:unnamed protein product [Paramecium primaurelia]